MQQSAVIARVLAALASTRLTLLLLVLFALAVAAGYCDEARAPLLLLGLALAALVLNFVAALIARQVFRRQAPLLVVHLALCAVVLLVGLGKMTRLTGRFELTQGVPFDGLLIDADAGAWHRAGLDRTVFQHDGFDIEYAPGLKRGRTRNAVQWRDESGLVRRAVIGDHEPLVLQGYRFYTTPNKGFAPVFSWQPDGSRDVVQGAVHLPSYPAQQLRQAREWALPGGGGIWVKLASEEVLIEPERAGRFQLPRLKDVVVRAGDARHEMRVGDTVALPGGRLHYAGLRTWMGYRVFYDWTLPWLLVASTLAALALGVHFWQRFRREPWRSAERAAAAASAHAATAATFEAAAYPLGITARPDA